MQADFLKSENLIHLIEIGVVAFSTYVGLKIRNEQLKSKLEIKDSHDELRQDFDDKHNENSQNIKVHIAEDKIMFDGIKEDLTEIKGLIKSRR